MGMTDAAPDLARYQRQMLLDGWGPGAQRRLAASHAAILGVGAIGCTLADLLARAGVGRVTLIDRDVVELTNLQRQVLFDERDVAEHMPKAEAAKRRLGAINSAVDVEAVVADFTHHNAQAVLLRGRHGVPDVLLDGTDNFEARLLLNDVAVAHALPYVYCGVVGWRGMLMTIAPEGSRAAVALGAPTACLRCLIPELPPPGTQPTCDTVGVFGPVVGMTVARQAGAAIGVLLAEAERPGPLLQTGLMEIEGRSGRVREITVSRGVDCACCVQRRFDALAGRLGGASAELCGQGAVQVGAGGGGIDLAALAARLAPHGRFVTNRFLLRGEFAREGSRATGEPLGITVFADGRAIVRGTTDLAEARGLHARYIGA